MKKQSSTALSADALLGKSKAYIRKALHRKAEKDLDEYQLWASLALELLGKARLSAIHPCLIADPQHSDSLFAAAGIFLSVDTKTVIAKTLFERLKHVTPHFDEHVSKFCLGIALRRNTELHSGDTPFKAMKLDAWETEYWYASSLLLQALELDLDDWLGGDQSEIPKKVAELAHAAKADAAKEKVKAAAVAFGKLPKAERERLLAEAEAREAFHYTALFNSAHDHTWSTQCPACKGKAYLSGVQVDEEIADTTTDEDGAWDHVETTYVGEQLTCPVCKLSLNGSAELEAVDMELLHTETSQREMEYEPDYGND